MGKWLGRGACKWRRDPPSAACDSCADNGFASPLGAWAPHAPAQFRCNSCLAVDAAKRRESVVDVYKNPRDPSFIVRDMFAVCARRNCVRPYCPRRSICRRPTRLVLRMRWGEGERRRRTEPRCF